MQFSPKSTMTNLLIIINVMAYCLMSITSDNFMTQNINTLIDFGALTKESSNWTIISSMFLHGGLIHIAFNMMALKSYGGMVEDLYEKAFLPIYFVSGIGACLGVILFAPGNAVTIGASGAICGLIGANLFIHLLTLKDNVVKKNIKFIWIDITLILIFSFLPGISASAHICGFLSGLLCSAAYIFVALPILKGIKK